MNLEYDVLSVYARVMVNRNNELACDKSLTYGHGSQKDWSTACLLVKGALHIQARIAIA